MGRGALPRVYLAEGSRWFRVDLRPWGGTRMVMKDPEARGWPARGERTDSQELAEEWASAYLHWIRGERRRRWLGLTPDQSLGPAVDAYLDHRSVAVERATWSADRTALNHLVELLGATAAVGSVETSDLQGFVDAMLRRGYRASTLRTYLKCWRTFFRKVGDWDPVDGVTVTSRAARPLDEVHTLSGREVAQIMAAAAVVDSQQIGEFPSAVLACGIGIYMGLRQGEIFALQWADIDAPTKTVRVRFQVPKDSVELRPTKGKLSRTALVLPPWWALHRSDRVGFVVGRTGRPVGTRTQRNLITRVLDTAGLNRLGVGWHIQRHTYAQTFLEGGGTIEQLSKSLGHSSIGTTQQRYEHLRPDVAAALARSAVYGTE